MFDFNQHIHIISVLYIAYMELNDTSEIFETVNHCTLREMVR